MQMYFKVDNFASNSTLFKTQYTRVVIDNNGWIGVIAPKTNNGQATSLLRKCWQLETGKFYSISLSYDGDKLYTLRLIDESGNIKKNDATLWGSELIYLGYTDNHFSSNECYFEFGSNYSAAFTGVIDECRFWTKELTDAMEPCEQRSAEYEGWNWNRPQLPSLALTTVFVTSAESPQETKSTSPASNCESVASNRIDAEP